MLDYTVAETAIETALSSLNSSDLEIMLWPDSEDEFNRPFKKARVSIAYHSSKYGEQLLSTAETTQEETVMFQLYIQARTLRQAGGIYQVRAAVLDKILGLKIPNFTKLKAVSFEQSERDAQAGGIFGYNLVMSCMAVSQQTDVDDPYDQDPTFADDLTLVNADYGSYPGTPASTIVYPLPVPPDTP